MSYWPDYRHKDGLGFSRILTECFQFESTCNRSGDGAPKIRVMKKPPLQKTKARDHVATAVRLPRDLHLDLKLAAEHAGRSLNAEIIARLEASRADSLSADIGEIKANLRKVLDAVT